MIETVIFDMDGVIVDSEPIHMSIEQQLFKRLGINVSIEEHSSYVGTSSQNMWSSIIKKNRLNIGVEDIVQTKKKLFLGYLSEAQNLKPIRGITEFINELKTQGFKLVLASSSNLDTINSVLFKLGLNETFLIRVSGEEVVRSKPDPEIFLKAAKLSNSQVFQCVVVEDSENGVTAAKLAGMKCVGYLNPNSGFQNLANADLIIESFNQIDTNLLKKI